MIRAITIWMVLAWSWIAPGQTVDPNTLPTTNPQPWITPTPISAKTKANSILDFGAVGNDIHDDTSAFTAARDACPPGQYVDVPAASVAWKITSTIAVHASVTFHSDNPTNSRIHAATGTGQAFLFGNDTTRQANVPVSSGYTRGSQQLTLSSVVGVSVGNIFRFLQTDDPAEWFGGGEGPVPHQCQMSIITNITGNVVKFTEPIFYAGYNATFSPYMDVFTAQNTNSGLDGIFIDYEGTAENPVLAYVTEGFYMTNCIITNAPHAEVAVLDSHNFNIQGNYMAFHQAYDSNARYGVQIGEYSTVGLVENNVLQGHNAGVIIQGGANGIIVSYNYTDLGFTIGSPAANVQAGGYGCHGDLANFNLFEGNIAPYYACDYFWGANRTSTQLRNWWKRVNFYNVSGSISSPVNTAIFIDSTNYFHNSVGNILGLPNQFGYGSGANPTYCVGYGRLTGSGDVPPGPVNDQLAVNRAFMHGDFDYASATINWSNGVTHTLPSSYYLASKPSWWCPNMAWPPLGPDVNISSTITNAPVTPSQARAQGVSPCSSTVQTIARVTNLNVKNAFINPH